LVGATYRVWSNLTTERANLPDLMDQLMIANDSKGDTVMLGDINLDVSRFGNILYGRRALLDAWREGYEDADFRLLPTSATWRSHGLFVDPARPEAPPSHRQSTLDYVYVAGRISPVATVLADSTTDHRPVSHCRDKEEEL
jgi:hypothetical protein